LKKWCREEKEGEALDCQREFWKIALNTDENLTDFALRLQTTYETAVPKQQRDVEVLKKQFLECIPKKLARRFKVRMGREKEAEKVKWKEIVRWAQEEDELEEEDNKEAGTRPQEPIPIWAAVGKNMNASAPVATQAQAPAPTYGLPTYAHALSNGQPVQQQRMQMQQGPQQYRPQAEDRRCLYCHKIGHIKRDCWKFLGWCLACGGNNHRVAECRNRRQPQRQERQQESASLERNMECFLCGEKGHGIQKCPEREICKRYLDEKKKPISGNEPTPAPAGGCREQQ